MKPSFQWKYLKSQLERNEVSAERAVATIDVIDKETRWSNTEPQWWLEMMAKRKELKGAMDNASRASLEGV